MLLRCLRIHAGIRQPRRGLAEATARLDEFAGGGTYRGIDAGAGFEHVVRTRVILTDIALWGDASKAHAEVFAAIRPVTTVMAVNGFVDPDRLIEIEVDAIIP